MPTFHRSIRLIVLGCASLDCTVLLHHFTSQLCKALAMLYNLFSTLELPEMVQAVRSRNVNLNIVNAPKHLSLFGSLRSIHSEFDPTLDPDVFYKSMKWTTLAVCRCAHFKGLQEISAFQNAFSWSLGASEAYYLSLACHNAALLNVKLGRWADAQELVDEGIEFTKASHLEGHAEKNM